MGAAMNLLQQALNETGIAPLPTKKEKINQDNQRMLMSAIPVLDDVALAALRLAVTKTAANLDLLRGGKADGKPDSDFSRNSLIAGAKVEREHTNNPAVAKEITKDHLAEFPNYYPALDKMEKKLKSASAELVKRAVNAARMMLRLGKLSPTAVKVLRQTPRRFSAPTGQTLMQLPTSEQYAAGLNKGTGALIFKSRGALANEAGFENKPLYAPQRNEIIPARLQKSNLRFSGSVPTTKNISFRQPVSINTKWRKVKQFKDDVLNRQLSSVLRRHETNEGTYGIANMIKGKENSIVSHADPRVLVEEGRSLVGLDPRVQQYYQKLRGGPFSSNELKQLRQRVGAETLQTGEYRRPPSTPKYLKSAPMSVEPVPNLKRQIMMLMQQG